jgi:hypothetical protein
MQQRWEGSVENIIQQNLFKVESQGHEYVFYIDQVSSLYKNGEEKFKSIKIMLHCTYLLMSENRLRWLL